MVRQRKSKGKKAEPPEDIKKRKVTKYSAAHKILVLGDGNFSFSRGLVNSMSNGDNVIATSYDSYDVVVEKCGPEASTCIAACKEGGAEVRHCVNAAQLHHHFEDASFQRIVFNFPHTGHQRVHVNRDFVSRFFVSARPLLMKGGELHITLKMQPPYSLWGIPELALEKGYVHYSTTDFDQAAFPGYKHMTTEKNASALDTSSAKATKAMKTLVFRRIAGPAPGAKQPVAAAAPASGKVQDAQAPATDSEDEGGPPSGQGEATPARSVRAGRHASDDDEPKTKRRKIQEKKARQRGDSAGEDGSGVPVQPDSPDGAAVQDVEGSQAQPAEEDAAAAARAKRKRKTRPPVSELTLPQKRRRKKNRAWTTKVLWTELRDKHVAEQLPLPHQAKQMFLEWVSTQWDLEVLKDNPKPWEVFKGNRKKGKDSKGREGGHPPPKAGKRKRSGGAAAQEPPMDLRKPRP
eukprot:jgi/Ulvmu1/3089/UM015_0129.1